MGFPSPVQNYYHGDNMNTDGIFNGSKIFGDCSRTPLPAEVIVARSDGEIVVSRLGKDPHGNYFDTKTPMRIHEQESTATNL